MEKIIQQSTPKFTVIVPCYNEEDAIRETIVELRVNLAGAFPYELLVVNDGSTDRSAQILEEIEALDSTLRVVHHEHNRGYGAALKTGISIANSELIVITDADRTYPNCRIEELVKLAQHADMVVGARTGENVTYPLIRKIPKWFLRKYASWIAGQNIPDINSGMRAFRKDAIRHFIKMLPDSFSFTTTITILMVRNYYKVQFVPIDYSGRVGKSKIKPVRDTLRFIQLIARTGMYFAPLRVLWPVILILTIGFFLSLAYDVFILQDLSDKTLLFLLFSMNTGLFALLADMLDKRTGN
jgi:glycosyltransferase involved in cell wall biosynthesis